MRKEQNSLKRDQNHDLRSFWRLISAWLVISGPLLSAAAGIDTPFSDGPVTKPQSVEKSTGEPFSVGYSFDYARTLVAKADAACEPGYSGEVLEGHFNEQGDPSHNAIRWLAHVDAPGHIHWAVRVGNETAGFLADLTCRQNVIYSAVGTGPNRGSVGKFDAESLSPIKTIQFSVAPLLNEAFFEFHREPSMPVAVSIIQDGGDSVALTIISQELEITLNKTYSLPAFATRSRDSSGRSTRYRVFRAQDGSGYYLVITDVARAASGPTSEVTRMGIIRTGLDGALKWSRLYSFSASGFGPLTAKVATDSAILAAAAYGAKSGKSFLVKIAPDGREAWAKIFDTPNTTFNDFHCDATPYRFIEPNLKAVGTSVSRGLPQAILLALDYATGGILYQTRFPGSFNGGAVLSDQKANSLYVSTLGIQFAKGGFKGVASISRFDHQLELISAKEIIGAEASFPLLTCGPKGVNLLSYEFSKPFRGVGSAINDNLEPVDVSCPWTRGLSLTMERCSYSSTDVPCREEPLDVEPGNGTATIEPSSFNLLRLALSLEKGTAPAIGARPVPQDPSAAQRSSISGVQKAFPRPLGDPQPVAYRASSEINTQSDGAQFSLAEAAKPKAGSIGEDPRYAPMDARLNKAYSALRSSLSLAKKEDLKRLEKDFLSRRDQLQGDPDAFFALTEKQIGLLEQMRASASGGSEPPLEKGFRTSTATTVVATSPDGKYQLTCGNDLVIGGSGTTPATLLSNLASSSARDATRVFWSPHGDKALVTNAGEEGTNSLQVAWLRGSTWTVDFCPETADEPRHYLGDNFKVLGWLSDDTFEVTNAIILNSREPLPAVRYKVRMNANGPAIVN